MRSIDRRPQDFTLGPQRFKVTTRGFLKRNTGSTFGEFVLFNYRIRVAKFTVKATQPENRKIFTSLVIDAAIAIAINSDQEATI